MEDDLLNESTGSKHDGGPPDSPRGSSNSEDDEETPRNDVLQAALQSERLSLNGFAPPAHNDAPTGHRKRPYQASMLSIHAPSAVLEPGGDKASEPKRKAARTEPIDPFTAALEAAKQEVTSQSSKVSVVDDIPPLSGSKNSKYCMWNIEKDLKELIDIFLFLNIIFDNLQMIF